VPKIIFTQTSTEYWNRAASLLHTDVTGTHDLVLDPHVRIYLVAGAQHLGAGPTTRGACQNPRNPLDDRPPILRAMLVALDRWVSGDQEPPPSRYPKIADHTLVDLAKFRETFRESRGEPAHGVLPAAAAGFRPPLVQRGHLGLRATESGTAPMTRSCPPWIVTATKWPASACPMWPCRSARTPGGTFALPLTAPKVCWPNSTAPTWRLPLPRPPPPR